MKKLSSITESDAKLPKGGMEMGILAVAVLIVLFFALYSLKDPERGIVVDRLTPSPGYSEKIENVRIVRIDTEGQIEFEGESYSVEGFRKFFERNPLEKEKVFYLRIEKEAPFHNYITVQDAMISFGISRERILLGGMVEDD